MPTVFWFKNIRFMIYTNDHGQPHVHAVGKIGEAKVRIKDGKVLEAHGFSFRLLRLISIQVLERKDELLEFWKEYHEKD